MTKVFFFALLCPSTKWWDLNEGERTTSKSKDGFIFEKFLRFGIDLATPLFTAKAKNFYIMLHLFKYGKSYRELRYKHFKKYNFMLQLHSFAHLKLNFPLSQSIQQAKFKNYHIMQFACSVFLKTSYEKRTQRNRRSKENTYLNCIITVIF